MREASYNSTLSGKIEKEIGGQCYKISDQSTLGLPDTLHILKGWSTFIECKIGKARLDLDYVEPLKSINDTRQYEVCRRMSKESLVLYAIYYPEIKWSFIAPVEAIHFMRNLNDKRAHFGTGVMGMYMESGHGIELVKRFMKGYQENGARHIIEL